jgi:hypothetical protein
MLAFPNPRGDTAAAGQGLDSVNFWFYGTRLDVRPSRPEARFYTVRPVGA